MVSMLRAVLAGQGYPNVTDVGTGAAALKPSRSSDVILLDNQLPDITGIDLLPRLLAQLDPPSVIMVTGEGNEELAATALRMGAEDYLVKGPELLESLPGILERTRRNRLLRSTKAEVERDLVRAERLAAIGEMTVTLHHELNNPLMAATAEVDLLLAETSGDVEAQRSLQSVRTALTRMRDIIKQAGDLQHADSADYLSGLSMINLASAKGPTATPRGRAVLWIPDQELARATSLLLRHAGFSVDRTATASEAETESARLDTTLIVMSVAGTGTDPLQGFRAKSDRRYALVALVPGNPDPARAAGADQVLTLPYDPATFGGEILAAMAAHQST